MRSHPISISSLLASATIGKSIRLALITSIVFLQSTTASFAAYSFLSVSGNNVPGNAASAQFTGANGVITVSHNFSPGGAGIDDNNDPLIFPSQFTTLFPGTGSVQGHLVQTVYNNTSVVTFDMTAYTITPNTVFGMWNTTDEVTAPVGGTPVYQVQLIDASNVQVNPSTFNFYGRQDNTGAAGVLGRHEMNMNPANGEITFGTLINASGTHTDATFWDNIPTTTQKIIVYGHLPSLNSIGDGVGYYFAEFVIPEPCSFGLCAFGILSFSAIRRRCRRIRVKAPCS